MIYSLGAIVALGSGANGGQVRLATAADVLPLATEQLGLSPHQLAALCTEAVHQGHSWRVRIYDRSPGHRGGPGGEVVIDLESGRILSRTFYR
jgi:hypothetical protein